MVLSALAAAPTSALYAAVARPQAAQAACEAAALSCRPLLTAQPQRRQQRRQARAHRHAAAAAAGSASAEGEPAVAAAPGSSSQPWISPAALRKVTAAADANEALDVLCAELSAAAAAAAGDAAAAELAPLSEAQCRELLLACLDRGNAALALSMYRGMSATAAAASAPASVLSLSSLDGGDLGGSPGGLRWPAASIQTAAALVVGLCRALQTREAIALINSVRSRGLATSEDVAFGHVVGCPQDSSKPLAVVQPQEGVKVVADSFSRYEYELFSGQVAAASSDSLVSNQNWLLAAARRAGILRRPSVGAVHTLLVETPSGQQRTFRMGTATADVPAKVGDRVTVVCAPERSVFAQRRRLLSAAPHGSKPGEALSLSNHSTRTDMQLLRPPGAGASGAGGLPSWALPAAVVLTAGDAASSLIDPALPYIAAGAVAATVAAGVAGNSLLLPRLKQLPARSLEVQATRQRLLAQHTELQARINELVDGSVEDVRVLARLWQLQSKMAAVGGEATYEARLDRVSTARAGVEQRLQKRIELVDSYARVIAMIEIEVEMDSDLPAAEVLGIEQQIARLAEVESLQEEWQLQAEAQDEVERLLRSSTAF